MARYYVEVATNDELVEAVEHARNHRWPLHVLGGGSNLVLTRDIPGLTIRMIGNQIIYEPVRDGAHNSVVVTAEAGTNWHTLVLDSLHHGFGGLENLSLIPGTVGAAPVQNIGAYGVELSDRLISLEAWQMNRKAWTTLTAEECEFGYRDSLFKRRPGEHIITRVRLALSADMPLCLGYSGLDQHLRDSGIHEPTHRNVSDAVIAIRRKKLPDPAQIGNAGSFFQNPVIDASAARQLKTQYPNMVCFEQPNGYVKVAAGWLIDSLGYKGHEQGGVGVHEHQALVLVHHGGSSGKQLMALADEIATAVHRRYGISLVPEPVII